MRIWTCSDAKGHYPVGFAAIIVANNQHEACILLEREMRKEGLKPEEGYTLEELPLHKSFCEILVNGDY